MPGPQFQKILTLTARIEMGHEKDLKERGMVLKGALDGPVLGGQGDFDLQKVLVSGNKTADPHGAKLSAWH